MTQMENAPSPGGPEARLRVGNCSGFYGDRPSAMREMLEGGGLDVLTGDYLAELTMLILFKDRMKDPAAGYARTFVAAMKQNMRTAKEKGVRIVVNAGGLNPAGCADAVRELAEGEGLDLVVAVVDGDDLSARAGDLGLGEGVLANAYLGAFGIAEACTAGADVVVTGRVTDASLVVGPVIAHFGWGREQLDEIAGAMAAGHIIECGTQATGGNFAFFGEVADMTRPGFPIAEVGSDGSAVITKHEGTGGAVTRETVLSQLLYEIQDLRYAGPDAVLRLDSLEVSEVGPDRVLVRGARGELPPPKAKVSCTRLGGFRNELEFVLTGLDIEAKADLVKEQMTHAMTTQPAQVEWSLAKTSHTDPDTIERAASILRVVARDQNADVVGRAFSAAAVDIALASYPGCFLTRPPSGGSAYGVYTAGYVDQGVPSHRVTLPDGRRVTIDPPRETAPLEPLTEVGARPPLRGTAGATRTIELGRIFGARSGDKGGSANVGVWARDDNAYAWLLANLTVEEFKRLLPETETLSVTRVLLTNLRALNFVVEGILGEGVAYGARFDPQAKALGEWLRARHIAVPADLVGSSSEGDLSWPS